MQDTDGAFYFLVYPRERRYENDVTPDKGDPQIVWPKTTSVTAAAVAALAACGSSPRFKEFPDDAARYLEKAKKGWEFLERAIAKYGKDGSYRRSRITATSSRMTTNSRGQPASCSSQRAMSYHRKLTQWFDPTDPNTRRWGWLRLCGL